MPALVRYYVRSYDAGWRVMDTCPPAELGLIEAAVGTFRAGDYGGRAEAYRYAVAYATRLDEREQKKRAR